MENILLFVIKCIYFMLPAYFANMAPVICKKIPFLKYPMDFGAMFRGKPLFGKNKTFRGLFFGVVFAVIVVYVQKLLTFDPYFRALGFTDYSNWVLLGILFGAGAIFGDMIESFFKRQLNIAPGKPFIPFDQTDFVIGSLILVAFTGIVTWKMLITILILSPFLHIIVNHSAYYLKIRGEKW